MQAYMYMDHVSQNLYVFVFIYLITVLKNLLSAK